MKIREYDPTNLEASLKNLESVRDHRREHPVEGSDKLYYELLLKHIQDVRNARSEGKISVCLAGSMYLDLLNSLDSIGVQTYQLNALCGCLCNLNPGIRQECFDAANRVGLRYETCSAHRLYVGAIALGYLPRPDVCVGMRPWCDCCAMSTELVAEMLDIPHFYMDRPVEYTQANLTYYAKEMEELVHFLENRTGRKVDPDRMRQTIANAKRVMQLKGEIDELKKHSPSPMRNRRGVEMELTDFGFCGRPEAVTFYTMVRDELKDRVSRGKGFIENEKYRLAFFYFPPTHDWKILDWMENTHGATVVVDTMSYNPQQQQVVDLMDPEKPYESFAREYFFSSVGCSWWLPVDLQVKNLINRIRDHRADGLLWFNNVSCTHTSGYMRIVKDELAKADIPCAVIDMDYYDPARGSREERREKVEAFLEILDQRK